MKALVTRVQRGAMSREDWSNLVALTIMWQGDETAVAIASDSLDTFIRVSMPVYEDHGFRHDDYKRMYDRICAAAARYSRDLVRH